MQNESLGEAISPWDDPRLKNEELDKTAINVKSHRLLGKLLRENPRLEEIMWNSKNETEALVGVKHWIMKEMNQRPNALKYYKNQIKGRDAFKLLEWKDYAAIRILDSERPPSRLVTWR